MRITLLLILKLSYIFLISILWSACSKKGGNAEPVEERDVTPPVITLLTPSNNQVFTAGETIRISATASDNVRLTQFEIHVVNVQSSSLLRDTHLYPGTKTSSIEDAFTAVAGASYSIKVIAYDARSNQSVSQVEVRTN